MPDIWGREFKRLLAEIVTAGCTIGSDGSLIEKPESTATPLLRERVAYWRDYLRLFGAGQCWYCGAQMFSSVNPGFETHWCSEDRMHIAFEREVFTDDDDGDKATRYVFEIALELHAMFPPPLNSAAPKL